MPECRAVLLVPNLALLRNGGRPKVHLAEVGGGEKRLVPIRTGYSDGFQTVVEEGLREGDVILTRSEGT